MRSVPKKLDEGETMCFNWSNGQYRFKPLYYVSDEDKKWYKEYYGIRYSDAYEVYGFKRTGCCGCSISSRATEDLELLKEYEPKIYKAAWNIFGDSYRYRKQYDEYRKKRQRHEKYKGQFSLFEGEL